MLPELCSGIFGFSGFCLLIKKFLFPSFVLFFRNFPWYRAFGALLFSARNALIQMITTPFASIVVIGASLNHNRALTEKFSLIFPPSTFAYNLFKLFLPLSPMKSRNRLFRRSWRIFFSLSPFLSLYLQQLLRTLFVFSQCIYKDRKGKTKVHKSTCPLFGSHTKERCQCPARLAAGTVDSLIAPFHSIFNNAGRAGPWCDLLGTGNPASHHSLKDYLHFLYQEQASSHISPKQSVPIFLDKLWKLCQHLNQLAYLSCDITSLNRYIFARDLAFFCIDFFSGDIASDLGRTLTKEVLSLPDNQGFVFRQSVGKTLRGKDFHVFAIRKCSNPLICPVSSLDCYVQLCKLLNVDLRKGYLLGPLTSNKIAGKSFVGSTVARHLCRQRLHLLLTFEYKLACFTFLHFI